VITLDDYAPIVGEEVVGQLHRLAEHLQGRRFVHINSTAIGGGVAEILSWAVPLMNQLGLQTTWEVIMGDPAFFEVLPQVAELDGGIAADARIGGAAPDILRDKIIHHFPGEFGLQVEYREGNS